MSSMPMWVVYAPKQELYWNHAAGWVDFITSATLYTDDEKQDLWLPVIEKDLAQWKEVEVILQIKQPTEEE